MAVVDAGGRAVVIRPVTSDEPDPTQKHANETQRDSTEWHAPEEVETTEKDRRSHAYVGPEEMSDAQEAVTQQIRAIFDQRNGFSIMLTSCADSSSA